MEDLQYRLFQQFEHELDELGGKAFLVKKAEISAKLQTILSENVRNVVVYQTPLLEKSLPKNLGEEPNHLSIHWLPQTKPTNFNYGEYRQMMIEADASIVAADYLIADSGGVVILGKHHRSQMATLLPPFLIVLATSKQIVEDIHILHEILRGNNQELDSIHYVAGPSRTADIEKTLILGVHGPKDLYVLVISEE